MLGDNKGMIKGKLRGIMVTSTPIKYQHIKQLYNAIRHIFVHYLSFFWDEIFTKCFSIILQNIDEYYHIK